MAAPDEETPFAGPPVDKNYPGKGKIAVLVVVLGLVGAFGYTTAHVGTSTATHLNSVFGPYDGCYMYLKWTCNEERYCSTPDEPRQFSDWPGCFSRCSDNQDAWKDVIGGSYGQYICKEGSACLAAYNKCQGDCTEAGASCDCPGSDDTWCHLG